MVERRLEIAATPALVAWIAADALRAAYPAADPIPDHRGAPVVATDDGFSIRYAGHAPIRVTMNGRLLPPALAQGVTALADPRLVAGCDSRAAPGPVRVEVDVRRIACGRVGVTISMSGGDVERRAYEHLLHAIGLAEPRDDPTARACCRPHATLLTAQRLRRSRELGARGYLGAAREQLVLALAAVPGSNAIRDALADLDARRGDDPAATAADELRTARLRLRAGDIAGAKAWALRARRHGDRAANHAPIHADIARATGDRRVGFALDMRRLVEGLPDPAFAVELALEAADLDTPSTGLRILARCWDTFDAPTRRNADELFDRLAIATGIELTCRILAAERAHALTERSLTRWRRDPNADRDAIALLERTNSLRTTAGDVARAGDGERSSVPPSPYYEGAPGVAAPPR